MPNPLKIANPLAVIKEYELQGRYNFVHHARIRLEEREVTVFEVSQVIRSGFMKRGKTNSNRNSGIGITLFAARPWTKESCGWLSPLNQMAF